MTIASIVPEKVLLERGFRKSKRGFFVPDFKKVEPYSILGANNVNALRQRGLKWRQIQYVASVLDSNEINSLHGKLEDALSISIVNSMSGDKLDWFYDKFRPAPVYSNMYHGIERQWFSEAHDYAKVNHNGQEPSTQEMNDDIRKYVMKRFRAWWRARFPEKTERRVWKSVRK